MVDTVVGIPKMLRNKCYCGLVLTFMTLLFIPTVSGIREESIDSFDFVGFGYELLENHEVVLSHDHIVLLPDRKLEPACEAFLKTYANLASEFIKCALEHARPLNFCETCVGEFVKAKSVFDYIMQVSDGTGCFVCGTLTIRKLTLYHHVLKSEISEGRCLMQVLQTGDN